MGFIAILRKGFSRNLLACALLVLVAAPGGANDDEAKPGADGAGTAQEEEEGGSFEWSGYMVAVYESYDFFRNAQDANPDRRARVDLERVIVEFEKELGDSFEISVEIEFEHGGTGAAVEFEPEEFGEFEQEVEQGGEIVLEHAYLEIHKYPRFSWRFGGLAVPFGMINTNHLPTDYFTLRRSPAETALFPAVWRETGVEMFGRAGGFHYRALLVNGLDSAGFNSWDFISGGNVRRLETVQADSLAVVGRLDWEATPGVLLGGAVYHGDTAANRPLPNLEDSAPLTMLEVHGRYERGPWTLRGTGVWGRLDNAEGVTQANVQSFNPAALGVDRSPVGSTAWSFFVAGGFDIGTFFPRLSRLDVFARYDAWDTMASTEGSIVDNPRYDVNLFTVGVNYQPRPYAVFKAEYARRHNGGTVAPEADTWGLSVGVVF